MSAAFRGLSPEEGRIMNVVVDREAIFIPLSYQSFLTTAYLGFEISIFYGLRNSEAYLSSFRNQIGDSKKFCALKALSFTRTD
jgi:hypothetical protein